VFELSPGRWHGPVLSGYGTHLVYVDALTAFPVPPLDEVRDQVTQDWVDDNRREITERYFADLLARYEVVIEGQPGDEPVDSQPASGA
jgi:parvulin-like peptidyl-prolyl isomerase